MFSFQQISRWLSFPADPLTVEDWLANREVFGTVQKPGDEDKELETAFAIEQARGKSLEGESKSWPLPVILNGTDAAGLIDQGDYVLIIPSGKAKLGKTVLDLEIASGSDKQKVQAITFDFLAIPVKADADLEIKIKCREGLNLSGKSEVSWRGVGKGKIIVDTRGRPVAAVNSEIQKSFMKKLYDSLS